MNTALNVHKKCAGLPVGNWVFSKLVCMKAPYFGTIEPVFQHLEPGCCEIWMKNRRAVRNHICSVHAVAMCCLAGLAAGNTVEVSLPPAMRWIPKGMQVQYLKIARTDLTAICKISIADLGSPQQLPMMVGVEDTGGQTVFRAAIPMRLTEKTAERD